jgi:hypothetical protein
MMKKQTAVEYLLSKLTLQLDTDRYEDIEGCDVSEIAEQAKQMEKQELEKFYNHGQWAIIDHGHGDTFEDYYKQTYSK